jgi:hypothetical protein
VFAEGKSILSQDKNWLDYEANLVDEEWVLEALEGALDYEQGLEMLSDVQKHLVNKL